jgi:hypothetical protein
MQPAQIDIICFNIYLLFLPNYMDTSLFRNHSIIENHNVYI